MEINFTPWRLEYIKSENKNEEGCIFCNAFEVEPSFSNLVITKTKNCAVMLNKYPYNNGHLLIVPKSHKDSLTLLSEEEVFEMAKMLVLCEKVLRSIYNPQGINLGMNLGLAAGAGIVEHIHYHILPRWIGDTNFVTVLGNLRAIPEDLKDTYEKVKNIFDSQLKKQI